MFKHIECDLPSLSRETVDGVRLYDVEGQKLVSITSVTSHFNKEVFVEWRKKVGDKEANRITKRATTRGTKVHTLIENHLLNKEVDPDTPGSKMLFNQAKKSLENIIIYTLSKKVCTQLSWALLELLIVLQNTTVN